MREAGPVARDVAGDGAVERAPFRVSGFIDSTNVGVRVLGAAAWNVVGTREGDGALDGGVGTVGTEGGADGDVVPIRVGALLGRAKVGGENMGPS